MNKTSMISGKTTLLAAILICSVVPVLCLSSARADGGTMIVYFNCSPDKHAAYVKAEISYEPEPDFGKNVTSVDKLTDEGKRLECNISSTQKMIINIRKSSAHPRNNNVVVMLNDKYLGDLTFHSYHDSSILVSETDSNQVNAMYFEDGIPRNPPAVPPTE
jgi:hypothetical protein